MKKACILAFMVLVVLSLAPVATAKVPTLPPQAPELTLPLQAQASDRCPLAGAVVLNPQIIMYGIMVPPVEI